MTASPMGGVIPRAGAVGAARWGGGSDTGL